MFISLFDVASHQIDMILIGHYLNSSLSGIYFITRRFGTLIVVPLSLFEPLVAASIAKFYANNNKVDINKIYQYSTKWIFIFSGILFTFLFVEAENVLKIVGKDYIAGAAALRIIAFGQLINSFVGPSGNTLIMSGKGKILIRNNLISIILGIGSAFYLIPNYEIIGAAISMSIVFSFANILSAFYIVINLKIYPMKLKSFFTRILLIILLIFADLFILQIIDFNKHIMSILFIGLLNFMIIPLLTFLSEGFSNEDKFILNTIKKRIIKK